MTQINAGVCEIKEEFVRKPPKKEDPSNKHKIDDGEAAGDASEAKKPKTENIDEKPKKQRGQNKARPKTFQDDKRNKPCPSIVDIASKEETKTCQYKDCQFIHDPVAYLKIKPTDIGETCHVYNLRGRCPRGIACRFGSEHITEDGFNKINVELVTKWTDDTKNTLQTSLQIQLQKRKYNFTMSETLAKSTDKRNKPKTENDKSQTENVENDKNIGTITDKDLIKSNNAETDKSQSENVVTNKHIGTVTDEDLIKSLPSEKKTIDWENKLYLAPLTTVGNLPFRRICKSYGVDITCGEMALCESILKGTKQEWALVKRHECEDLFGVQICGNNVYQIAKVSQLLQENTTLDFIDLNLGCPIDLIYKKGGGCGMMHRLPSLEASVTCSAKILNIPFTVKIRTGVYQDKKIAHTIVPKLANWGASMITLHGRSREARYTRSADWEYIETCAKAAAPCPVFGNGDIMSYDDYVQRRALAPTTKGAMIGRGALIKPWIFTEIKEQKLWDISSSERFDILKKYTNYGLEHWGSDTQGVENTRRFLLEWLSFLYRYVPVGLLERPPQKINERPPIYFGRDDMETLMASGNCNDWVKISEMLLGPVPDGFQFLPKHKANSY